MINTKNDNHNNRESYGLVHRVDNRDIISSANVGAKWGTYWSAPRKHDTYEDENTDSTIEYNNMDSDTVTLERDHKRYTIWGYWENINGKSRPSYIDLF